MKKIYALAISFFGFFLTAQAQVTPGICMVTVDDSSKHNVIYYDKTQFAVADSFILWRETNVGGAYARVMANHSSALSLFLDMDPVADPNLKLNRYKLQIWDVSNGYSQLSPYHTVLYCLQNDSNYNWNQYDVEGTGTGLVNSYVVLQDDNSTNQWHPIDTLAGSVNAWVDHTVNNWPNGQWRLATLWSISCTPTARYGANDVETAVVKSKSNITNNRTTGINILKANTVNLFPNPASDRVTMRLNFPVSENTWVKIYNAVGVEMLSAALPFAKDEFSIPLNGLQKGIYFVEFSNTRAKFVKRLAID